MIIIRLHGGLGNQMFQYALGRNLSLLHNATFKIDSSYLQKPNQSGRNLRLQGFNISIQEATFKEIGKLTNPIQKVLDLTRSKRNRKRLVEEETGFKPEILSKPSGYFDGHWQSEKYFIANEETVRKDFTLINPLGPDASELAKKISSESKAVSVHIRRGDYVSIPKISAVHRTLPVSYYESACRKILEKFPDAHFFISSDDIDWARKNFPKQYPATFISSPEIPDYEELILMSLCKHNIIANSTFSWWGAWLNKNPNKIVITPKQWFNDPKRSIGDLIPKSWLQI